MKKLKLELSDLEVQAFPTTDVPVGELGTVFAKNTNGEYSCNMDTCLYTWTVNEYTCDQYCGDFSNGCDGSAQCGPTGTSGYTFMASCC